MRVYDPKVPIGPLSPPILFGSHASMIQNLENAYNWYCKDMSGVNVRMHPAYAPEAALAIAVT